jgi:hypothetical protein
MDKMTESLKATVARAAARAPLAAVAACALVAACSQTPTSPTGTATGGVAESSSQGTSQGWQDFAARGWNCRTPAPNVAVCSPPGQPLPTVAIPPAQPPADRPATVMLKRWINDVFNANVLLLRPEIYNGQPCGSTGEPFTFISVLGYFECAHLVGG